MIDLLRELATFVLAWCVGITLTYGVVESALMMSVRIALSAAGEHLGFLETLLYCPFCTGFWCQGVAWLCFTGLDLRLALGGACIGTTLLLVARAFDLQLIRSPYDVEKIAIEELRARHAEKEPDVHQDR